MITTHRRAVLCCLPLLLLVLGARAGWAQRYEADRPLGAAAPQQPEYLRKAGISQNLNSPLPLDDMFLDESGHPVPLRTFFSSGKPAVMALVYFKCAMLCPEVLHGMGEALAESGLHPGHDYQVVVASIDPSDTPADAAPAKARLVARLGADPAAVHFLTGAQGPIDDLAGAIGFHYVRVPGPDGRLTQFAHSSVIMIATPEGRLSKYLAGVDYQPRDLRLAVLQAGHARIGSLADLVLIYCCNYTPAQGRYTVAILRVLGLAASGFLALFALTIYLVSRKPRPTPA